MQNLQDSWTTEDSERPSLRSSSTSGSRDGINVALGEIEGTAPEFADRGAADASQSFLGGRFRSDRLFENDAILFGMLTPSALSVVGFGYDASAMRYGHFLLVTKGFLGTERLHAHVHDGLSVLGGSFAFSLVEQVGL